MNLDKRIEQLERQSRLYRNLFLFAALLLVAAITYGATTAIPDVIQARKFEVVNQEGAIVVDLGSGPLMDGNIHVMAGNGKKAFSLESISGPKNGIATVKIKAPGIIETTFINAMAITLHDIFDKDNGPKINILYSGITINNRKSSNELLSYITIDASGIVFNSRIIDDVKPLSFSEAPAFLREFLQQASSKRTRRLLRLTANDNGGLIWVFGENGKIASSFGSDDTGGYASIWNKTTDIVVQLHADEYGNGVVSAYNRQGKGRHLKPGP